MRSSTFSMPTERRTSPSSMPRLARTSSGSEAWVMMAGCSIRLSTPPRLSASVKSSQRSRKRREAGVDHACDLRVLLEKGRDVHRVAAVALHPDGECLDAAQGEEGVERTRYAADGVLE